MIPLDSSMIVSESIDDKLFNRLVMSEHDLCVEDLLKEMLKSSSQYIKNLSNNWDLDCVDSRVQNMPFSNQVINKKLIFS